MTDKQRAAIQHIQEQDTLYISAAEIGPAIACDPRWIRICARKDRLPFPVERRGKKKVVFPRQAFLNYIKEVCGHDRP